MKKMFELFELLEKSTKEDTVCGKFLKIRDQYEELVFFGAGLCCHDMLKIFSQENITMPLAIVDNDIEKHGENITGIPIISLATAVKEYSKLTILITTSMYIPEVTKQVTQELSEIEIISFTPYEFQNFEIFKPYVMQNKQDFVDIYQLFQDENSKQTWYSVLMGRCTGNYKYYQAVYTTPQYFPEKIITFGKEEVFLDIGAFTGDTAEEFIKQCQGCYKKIIAVEPNPLNHLKINEAIAQNTKITLVPKGVSDQKEILFFDSSAGSVATFHPERGDTMVEVDCIDFFIKEEITFLKMDIEGFELRALHGAEKTIRKWKPKLAICLYHHPKDFVEIVRYIEHLSLDYKFYVRHHMVSLNETVLYAI